jgi:hypothetical protein
MENSVADLYECGSYLLPSAKRDLKGAELDATRERRAAAAQQRSAQVYLEFCSARLFAYLR